MKFVAGQTVGIDLGTTYSTIAHVNDQGEPIPLPNEDDDVETASLILLADAGTVIVGPDRRRAVLEKPENVIERIKRDMGTSDFQRTFDGREVTPEFVSGLILKKLKQDAEKRIGPIGNAVITVPYYFNDSRRKATQDAGEIAGLNVVDIINEPTAATLTYAWHCGELGAERAGFRPRHILVYDLGGGTFDATLVRYTPSHFHVLATDGDVELGGVDWNDRILDRFCEEFREKNGIDPRESAQAKQELRLACDFAKIELSEKTETVMSYRFEGKGLTLRLTRDEFESMTADLLQRTRDTTDFVIEQAGIPYSQLDALVLTGGSTLMPAVRRMLEEVSGIKPYTAIDPHTSVAKGAAIHAAILEVKHRGGGDASRGEKVKKMLEAITQEDVNSHSLGVVVLDPKTGQPINRTMIPRNTTLPFSMTQVFNTNKENQQRVNVKVVEGDAPDPAACLLLGKCSISGLPENLPKGSPVEVTYEFDKAGRIAVSAREKTSGQEAVIEIDRKGLLSEQQVTEYTQLAAEYTVQ
ncbi:MAG: Hsp70 family protein [Thermoguttaceae bacterium]